MAGSVTDVVSLAGDALARLQPYATATVDTVRDFLTGGAKSEHQEVMVAVVEPKAAPTPMAAYQAAVAAEPVAPVAVAAVAAPEQKVTVALVNVKKTGKKIEATAQHSKSH